MSLPHFRLHVCELEYIASSEGWYRKYKIFKHFQIGEYEPLYSCIDEMIEHCCQLSIRIIFQNKK